MKLSEFRRAVVDEFGAGYGAVLTRDLALRALGGKTAEEALSSGVDPREVWLELCRENDIPRERWHGVGLPEPRR